MRSIFAALLGVLAGCVFQTKDCTLVACSGSLTVTFEVEPLADGTYRVEAEYEGAAPAVTFEIVDGVVQAPDDTWVGVEQTEDGLVASFGTGMGDMPETVDVRLLDADGAALLEGTVTPTWGEPWYPNGEECDEGMGCNTGTATIGP